MRKWFTRTPSNVVDLFRCEFPYEYQWAMDTKQVVNEKYVANFLKSQNIFQS